MRRWEKQGAQPPPTSGRAQRTAGPPRRQGLGSSEGWGLIICWRGTADFEERTFGDIGSYRHPSLMARFDVLQLTSAVLMHKPGHDRSKGAPSRGPSARPSTQDHHRPPQGSRSSVFSPTPGGHPKPFLSFVLRTTPLPLPPLHRGAGRLPGRLRCSVQGALLTHGFIFCCFSYPW